MKIKAKDLKIGMVVASGERVIFVQEDLTTWDTVVQVKGSKVYRTLRNYLGHSRKMIVILLSEKGVERHVRWDKYSTIFVKDE